MNDSPDLSNLTVGLAFVLFIVWMQRHHRWSLFWQGLTGRLAITGSRISGGSGGPPPTSSSGGQSGGQGGGEPGAPASPPVARPGSPQAPGAPSTAAPPTTAPGGWWGIIQNPNNPGPQPAPGSPPQQNPWSY